MMEKLVSNDVDTSFLHGYPTKNMSGAHYVGTLQLGHQQG